MSKQPTKHSWKSAALAAAIAGLTLAGCGTEVEPVGKGTFDLTWDVSPRGCEAADVEVVQVELANAKREYIEQYDCLEQTASIQDVEPAKYDLRLIGLDATGHASFESQPRRVTIDPQRENVVDMVRLTAKPSDLRVNWTFANSRVCGANGVESVEVALFDSAYYEVGRRTFGCDRGSGVFEGLRAGAYTVEAVAESADDDAEVYQGLSETSLKRGDQGHVEVVLE